MGETKTGRHKVKDFKNFSQALNYWAEHSPDKMFLHDVSVGKSYNYSEFNRLVNKTVRLLQEQGIKYGDIVSICIRNSNEFLVIYFAIIRLGGLVNPMPVSLSAEEIIKNLDFVKAKIVFLEKAKEEKISPKYKTFVVEFKGDDSFVNQLNKFSDQEIDIELKENDPACLYYTSGTISNPKGILYSHKNMVSLISSICRCFNHTFDSIHLGILPMGHTAITNYNFLPVVYAGGTMVFSENFMKIRTDFWKIIEKYRVTYVETVPTILFMILNTKYPDYSKGKISKFELKYIGCGSAPLPLAVQKDFQERFGLPVANLYGLSETGPTHFDNPFEKGWEPGSIGVPIDVNECKIFDDDLNELPVGELGEIALKGDNVFIGYYQNEKAYKEAVKNGWFLTGDLGYKGKDDKFYYVDRKKDLIIKGGVNIFPGEVDEVIFKHPSVKEASTIGIPDRIMGEDVVSFVVPKENATINEKELIDYCRKHLQPFKCPKRIVAIDEIPKTASGKLLRKHLREIYNEKYN